MPIRSFSRPGKVYRFVLKSDEYLVTTIKGFTYRSANGLLQLSSDGRIDIKGSHLNGYAWDGCTPKWEIVDFLLGTPDGRLDYFTEQPITYYASLVHDALYQFKSEIPISRLDTDLLFCKILKEAGFMWWWLYYLIVRLGGGFFGKWKRSDSTRDLRIIECSWIKRAYEDSLDWNNHIVREHPFVKIGKTYGLQK